jgi:HEAT repeat protein
MKPVIQQLLKELETGQQDVKLSCLLDIYDYLDHPYPHEEGYAEVVQQLIVLLSKESDHQVRRQIVRNIEKAYMCNISLEQISFEPVIGILNEADPFFIRSILYLLSMTYNRKYIPLIEKYLDHPDEEVRKEAQYILDTW